jgi:methionine synthase II (cobalamin-independent)
LRETVDSIVDKQVALGIDIVNDGELSKGNWLGYLNARLSGFEQRPAVPGPSFLSQGKDCEEFSGYYSEAMRLGTMFYSSATSRRMRRPPWYAMGPVQTTMEVP